MALRHWKNYYWQKLKELVPFIIAQKALRRSATVSVQKRLRKPQPAAPPTRQSGPQLHSEIPILIDHVVQLAIESQNPKCLESAKGIILQRLLTLTIRQRNMDRLLELFEECKKLGSSPAQDHFFACLANGLFRVMLNPSEESAHGPNEIILYILEAMTLVSDATVLSEELVLSLIRYFYESYFNYLDFAEEWIVTFTSSLGNICVRLGLNNAFLILTNALLDLGGSNTILKAMGRFLDHSFKLWILSQDPSLIAQAIYITEILASRPLPKRFVPKRDEILGGLVRLLLQASITMEDGSELLERATAVVYWINGDNERAICLTRIITQLSLLGYSSNKPWLIDKAISLMFSMSPEPIITDEVIGGRRMSSHEVGLLFEQAIEVLDSA
jgi:hypothetical protein